MIATIGFFAVLVLAWYQDRGPELCPVWEEGSNTEEDYHEPKTQYVFAIIFGSGLLAVLGSVDFLLLWRLRVVS